MSFLNPALLACTAAVAVPILIHLLNRRRFQRVSWAAMRFVRASLEKNRRRMQMEDFLLLLLRCLVVALFALALARPAWRSAPALFAGGRVAAAVILDTSASLGAGDGTRTRFELARQAAEAAVDSFAPGSAIGVVLAGDRLSAPALEPTPDLRGVRKALREATPTDLATDHAAGVAAALELLRDRTALRKEIILVTDRQDLGWRRLPELASALDPATRNTRLRVVLVGEPADDNLAVAGLSRSAGFASARDPLRFQAEIANRGSTPLRQVRATLHVDDGPAIDEAVFESLAPGESRRATFFARIPAPGFHAVRVQLPPDRVPFDDRRQVVVRAVDSVRVLVVDGDAAANAAFFLRNALQPVPADLAPDYFLQPRVITPGQLALTRLPDYAAVILADPAPLLPGVVDQLQRYVAEGGALVIFPGPQAKPDFYQIAAAQGLAPATLARLRGNPDGDEFFALQSAGYEHPVFALWNEGGSGSLASARFRAAWELTPTPARTNDAGTLEASTVMVRFADGAPAAMERGLGRGRVMMFASTAGTAWNDLPVRAAFVPLLHRSLASLADAADTRYNVPAGGRVTLRLPAELTGREAVITTPDQPERRLPLGLRAAVGGAVLEFDDTQRAGVYRAKLTGATETLAQFAAQPDPAESDLTELGPERRAELERVAQVVDWSPDLDLAAAFDRERVGVEFWVPLVLGVLLLGVAETWLAQWFSRPK
jgi:hypothetical protein